MYYKEPENCQSCHGEELKGKNVEVPCKNCESGVTVKNSLSCQTCHLPSFPHRDAFKKCQEGFENCGHGLEYVTHQKKCFTCHSQKPKTVEFGGKTINMACNTCHTAIPHTPDYFACAKGQKEACQHGEDFNKDQAACLKCHKVIEDETYPDRKSNALGWKHRYCLKCHDYPHPRSEDPNKKVHKDWVSNRNVPHFHGSRFLQEKRAKDEGEPQVLGVKKDQTIVCADCHNKNSAIYERTKGAAKECSKCHRAGVPHNEIFLDPEHHRLHGKLAKENQEGCISCHLSRNLKKMKTLDQLNHLFPKKRHQLSTEKCFSCHKGNEQKILAKDKTTKKYCLSCHSNGKPQRYSGSLSGGNRGCVECHSFTSYPDFTSSEKSKADTAK